MSLNRVPLALAAVLLLVATMVMFLGTPSEAVTKNLLISSSADGPFRDHLSRPLFKGEGPFVPLDRADSTFYVKNNSSDTARATLAVVNRGTSNDLESALSFDVDIQGTKSSGALPSPGRDGCALITTGPSIEPGDVQAVDLSLAMADVTGQEGMAEVASLDFVLTLSQVGENGEVDVCGEQADAEPEAEGEQGEEGEPVSDQCRRDVVVTVAGEPSCVPTVVDAGATYGLGEPRSPGTVAFLAAVLVSLGAGMLLLAGRRRRIA